MPFSQEEMCNVAYRERVVRETEIGAFYLQHYIRIHLTTLCLIVVLTEKEAERKSHQFLLTEEVCQNFHE